ncbi:hypothetical protein ABIB25_003577 [Nakamurella sp. UYEF19]|uniref:YciI family protein n=1 Tax=Nakamurella sp. UYEF19 TaxID=1756392 RepID=UPI00339845B7
MTEYLLSVHNAEGDHPDVDAEVTPEMLKAYQQVDGFNADLTASGAWVFAGGLHPPTTSTVVSVSDGQTLVTDGPFTESKEHLGGFWIIDVDDLDVALDWARRASEACMAPVEVRPFQGA